MSQAPQKIAVIGAGISGLASAYFLAKRHEVTLFESNTYLGGHTNTVDIRVDNKDLSVDTGFLVFNDKTYPNLIALFAELGVESYASDMSFGVSIDNGRVEWAGTNLDTVFAQRGNLLSPSFLMMIKDILRFNSQAEAHLQEAISNRYNLGELLDKHRYRKTFRDYYLIPMAAAIWSSSPKDILRFPASTFLRFCLNHSLLQVNNRPQWKTVKGGGKSYVKKIAAHLKDIRLNSKVNKVIRSMDAVEVFTEKGFERFDSVIFATHAPDTLAILSNPSDEERDSLGKFQYQANTAYLHTDENLLPKNKKVWSAWNYLSSENGNQKGLVSQAVCVSYLLNQLQDLQVNTPVVVTLNPDRPPQAEKVLRKFEYEHPIFDQAAVDAQTSLEQIQGKDRIWFAGAWTGYGFHEDGLKSALRVVRDFQLQPSWTKLD